jgi:hypothetical protein
MYGQILCKTCCQLVYSIFQRAGCTFYQVIISTNVHVWAKSYVKYAASLFIQFFNEQAARFTKLLSRPTLIYGQILCKICCQLVYSIFQRAGCTFYQVIISTNAHVWAASAGIAHVVLLDTSIPPRRCRQSAVETCRWATSPALALSLSNLT